MCNDPAVIITMVANSACLLGCRTMLYRLDIKSLILLLISVARSMLNTAEGGYPIQLDSNSSQSRAANMAEGGEASSGRHIHREGLGSPQVPTYRPSPSLGIHIWNHCVSSSSSGGRGKLSTQILTHYAAAHRSPSSYNICSLHAYSGGMQCQH